MSDPETNSDTRRSNFPEPARPDSKSSLLDALNEILFKEYLVIPLGEYTIFTEGLSDIDYIHMANEVVKKDWGLDILKITKSDEDFEIDIKTPRNPDMPTRGGVGALGRLVNELSQWRHRNVLPNLAFVFDHDTAGKAARSKALGNWQDKGTCISLDPREHATCNFDRKKDEVDIESLIDLKFQVDFFNSLSETSAWVHYKCGNIYQIFWEYPSKEELRNHVSKNATADDLREIARIVLRIREAWGVPIALDS